MQLRALFSGVGSFVRYRSRHLLALVALSTAPLAVARSEPAGAPVRVEITGLRSDKGVVRACMTTHAERFPQCRGDADAYSQVVSASGAAVLEFRAVRPGRYAIALLHDENGNGKADRALGMMPREGFGFSRDAPVRLGPPSFGSAAFEIDGAGATQTIRMRYML
jgi:uncharacterized protein (DUF2141 family)